MGRMSTEKVDSVKRSLLRQIGGQLMSMGMPRGEFYKRIRMANSTFKKRENNPGDFTLNELFLIAHALNVHLYVSIGKEEGE